MCSRLTTAVTGAEVAALLGLQATAAGAAWSSATELLPGGQVLVVAPWRGQHLVGVAIFGRPGFEGPKPIINARRESLDRPYWRDTVRCLVVATCWWHVVPLPTGKHTATGVHLKGRPFGLQARGVVERDGRLHVALVSYDAGGTNLFLPQRQPVGRALSDHAREDAPQITAWDWSVSGLLKADGTPDDSPSPPDKYEGRVW